MYIRLPIDTLNRSGHTTFELTFRAAIDILPEIMFCEEMGRVSIWEK